MSHNNPRNPIVAVTIRKGPRALEGFPARYSFAPPETRQDDDRQLNFNDRATIKAAVQKRMRRATQALKQASGGASPPHPRTEEPDRPAYTNAEVAPPLHSEPTAEGR